MQLDPFDPSILPYISDGPPSIKCGSTQLSVLYTVNNSLFVNNSALKEQGYHHGLQDVLCSYRYIGLPNTDQYSLSEEYFITEIETGATFKIHFLVHFYLLFALTLACLVLSSNYSGVLVKCTQKSLSWFDLNIIPVNLLQFAGIVFYQNILLYVQR